MADELGGNASGGQASGGSANGQDIAGLSAELAAAQRELTQLRLANAREQHMAGILSQAVDADVIRTMLEKATRGVSDPAQIPGAVIAAAEELRRGKPFLFRSGATSGSRPPTATGRMQAPIPLREEEIAALAKRAKETGSRRDLQEYLRARKGE